jgi:HAD superfamily phosphoserine phosphatase-like hydrolase
VLSLGIDEFLSTEPEFVNGRITGKIVGTPTFREGKVERLNVWLQENHETLSGSYFYSDSINDLPLLSAVEKPVAVDPDDSLRQMAREQGWDIISLRD